MIKTLDLGSRNGGLGAALSNFAGYSFVLDDVKCGSMEGWLQSLKHEDLEGQEIIAGLVGYKAYKVGQIGNDWRDTQTLWWRGKPYERTSRQYHALLERGYDACFDQNKAFQDNLFQTGADVLTHVIGHHDPKLSVLTEWEYIYNMYRLRARAQQIAMADLG